ncbi:MAG: SPOR domain-containing protein [Deltaproteobacteria bacterium]|nr:SPOR domain-containing protein [Deltaproteobacteria bacterium]
MPSREPELYKDKVEVSLDGRQIFYLFFGGSVIVGIVFVLGVLVGRRVEARGHIDRARTHTASDPLAALDRLEGSGGLSFQGALTGKDAPSSVEKTIDQIEKQRAEKKPEPKVEKKVEAPKVEKKAEEKKADAKKTDEAKAGPIVKPEPDKKSEPKAEKKAEPVAEKKPDEPKSRYTLQLSSFQDRSEAEAFLDSVKSQGFSAQITQAEVEGKGTFYRVRMGTYRSMDAATSAKSELEKAGKSASIMKL